MDWVDYHWVAWRTQAHPNFHFQLMLISTLASHHQHQGRAMGLCDDDSPLDFGSPCIRASWSAFLPAALVFALCVSAVPLTRPIRRLLRPLGAPLQSYLTLHEAEAIDITAVAGEPGLDDEDRVDSVEVPGLVPVWRTVVFVFVGIVQAFCWVAAGAFRLYNNQENVWDGVFSFVVAASWMYTVLRPIARPTATPPYDMFALYLAFFFTSILQLGGVIFDHSVLGVSLPSALTLTALIANLVVVFVLLTAILAMPLDIPSNRVDKKDIVSFIST